MANHKRKYSNSTCDSPDPVPTKNKFDPLTNNYNSTPGNSDNIPPPNPPKLKILSINIIYKKSWLNTLNNLVKILDMPPVCQMAGSNTKLIKCHKLEDYTKYLSYLKNKKIKYYTYQVPTVKNHEYVIHLLPVTTDPKLIKNELNQQGFNVINVIQLTATRPTNAEKEGKNVRARRAF